MIFNSIREYKEKRIDHVFSAESQGVVAASIFLILMFIMIAIVFSEHLHPQSDFPHNKVILDNH